MNSRLAQSNIQSCIYAACIEVEELNKTGHLPKGIVRSTAEDLLDEI